MSSSHAIIRWHDNRFLSEWVDEHSTELDTASDDITRYGLSERQWGQFLGLEDVAGKMRLHYYLLTEIEGRDFETLMRALFDRESEEFRRPDTQLSGTAIVDSYLYLFFVGGQSEEIKGIVVLRPHSDLAVVRVSEDDFADRIYLRLATLFGDTDDEPVRPAFDAEYHRIFEAEVVDRYIRLWIELGKETDQRINKIQFISESGENARESDRVTEILSLSGAKLYVGQVEASGYELTQQRSFFFNWKHKRVTFQSRPTERTKLEVSGTLDRIRSITLTPPIDRIMRIEETPIRTEVYAGEYASTWRDRLGLREFAASCAELGVLDDASVIVYLPEGEGRTMSFGEFREEPPESSIFVRVNSRESSFTWERLRELPYNDAATMLGVISGDGQPERIADAFSQFTDRHFTDAAATTLENLLQTPPEVREE